jgi:hypothetical protein
MIGGSRIAEAFKLEGMAPVMAYGFFGNCSGCYGGLALLIFHGKSNHVRKPGAGMAGSLSHSGLTGACTAGDWAQKPPQSSDHDQRAILRPYFCLHNSGISVQRGQLLLVPAL